MSMLEFCPAAYYPSVV